MSQRETIEKKRDKKFECLLIVFSRPGNDLLSHTLRCSTISAEVFNDRVRDGIGFRHFAIVTKPAKDK